MNHSPGLEQFEELLEFLPVSEDSPCSYYADRVSRYRAFRFDGTLSPDATALVISRGYRRCGSIYYAVSCPNCRACTPYRLTVDGFVPSKSQRRVLSRNRDLQIVVGEPELTDEKRELYLKYSEHQHPNDERSVEAGPPRSTEELLDTLEVQLYSNPASTREFQLLAEGGRLLGFGIMDISSDTVSAVYNVYDPSEDRRSLGTFSILWTLQWAKDQGMSYVNLGYFISGHPKMDYKRRFQPSEVMDWKTNGWREFMEKR